MKLYTSHLEIHNTSSVGLRIRDQNILRQCSSFTYRTWLEIAQLVSQLAKNPDVNG
jgi:hypothetical protein